MRPVTLALAKNYTDKKIQEGNGGSAGQSVQADWNQNDQLAPDYIKNRVAWTEPSEITTYTFDGKLEGKEYIYLEEVSTDAHKNYLVKIADEVIPSDAFESLELYTGIIQKVSKNMLLIESIGTSWAALLGPQAAPLIVSAEGIELFGSTLFGTYVFYGTEKLGEVDSPSVVVSSVYCSVPETVHKLDTKYLPNGGVGYEEEKVVLADVELMIHNTGDPSVGEIDGGIGLEVGKSYTVVLDSGTYSCICKNISVPVAEAGDMVCPCLGNASLANSSLLDTGESFLIVDGYDTRSGVLVSILFVLDTNNSTKCNVYSGGTVHPIDPKFLPEGGFGWTENTEGSLTFDGNIEGKEVIPVGPKKSLVKISNDAIDLTSVKEIDIMFVFKEQLTPGPTLTAGDLTTIEYLPGVNFLLHNDSDMPMVTSLTKDTTDEETGITLSAGTWTAYQAERVADEGMYVSAIRFGNKVDHKIDPKFLPEGGVGYEEDAVKFVEVELDSIGIAYGQVSNNMIYKTIGLEGGKEYIVQTNSGTFTSVCSEVVLTGGVVHRLGNPGIMNVGAEDTGESYFILEMNDNDGQSQTHFYDANNGTKMAVYARGEIHKIDPKYYDRLAWVEGGQGEILPETAITTADDIYIIMNFIGLTNGSKYTVTFDGIEYETECAVMTFEGQIFRYIGNIALVTGDEDSNTEEPFIVLEATLDGVEATGIVTMLDGEHTISISGDGEIIHKINPKFLHTPDMEAATGEPGYIANKPLSRTPKMVRLVSDASLANGSSIDVKHIYDNGIGVLGKKVLITYDGTQYETLIIFTDGYDLKTDMPTSFVFGNIKLIPDELGTIDDNELPCIFIVDEGTLTCRFADEYIHTISIDIEAYDFNTLDYHYLPQSMTLSHNFTSDTLIPIGDEFFAECKKANHAMRAGQKVYANVNNILTEVIELNGIYTRSNSSDFRMKSRSLDNLIEYQVYRTDKTGITETLVQPQADYAQNDETKPDYVKNRIAWTEPRTTILPMTTVEMLTGQASLPSDVNHLELNQKYIVTWDGIEYECICKESDVGHDSEGNTIYANALEGFGYNAEGNAEKIFLIYYIGTTIDKVYNCYALDYYGAPGGTHTVQVDAFEKVHKIDSKFIPNDVPSVQTAEIGQALIIKNINENGQPTEWETINLKENLDLILKLLESVSYTSNQSENISLLKLSLGQIAITKLLRGSTSFVSGSGLQIHRGPNMNNRATIAPVGQYLKNGKTYRFYIKSGEGEETQNYSYGVQIMQASEPGLKFDSIDGIEVYYDKVTSRLVDTGWMMDEYVYSVNGENQIFTMNFKNNQGDELSEQDCQILLANIVIEEVE